MLTLREPLREQLGVEVEILAVHRDAIAATVEVQEAKLAVGHPSTEEQDAALGQCVQRDGAQLKVARSVEGQEVAVELSLGSRLREARKLEEEGAIDVSLLELDREVKVTAL